MPRKKVSVTIFIAAFLIAIIYNSVFCRNAEVLTRWSQHIDGLFYQAIAETLVEHGIFGYNEFRPTSFRPPLYPIFLSGTYCIFGYNFFIVRIFQAIFHGLTCVFIFLIGENIFDRKTGILCALLVAFNPFLIFFSGEIGTESLFTLLVSATVYAIVKIDKEEKKTLPLVLCGIIFSAAMLTRTIFLSFLPFLLGWFYFTSEKKTAKRKVIIFFLSFFTALLPWIIRNYNVHGHLLISGTNMGHNINIGALMEGVDYAQALRKFKKISGYDYKDLENPKNKKLPASEYELQQEAINRTIEIILSDPLKWIKVRFLNAVNLWSNNWQGNYAKRFEEGKKPYIKLLSHYYYLFILSFGAAGIILALNSKRENRDFTYLILLLFFATTAGYCVFQTGKRYRVPTIDPYLSLYASYLITFLVSKAGLFREKK
ncbi:MAG: phospholipid carrier-dependent glycosyltransferase [Candidatus Schekmanbacteria bacterium]|nr:MAG: phospholipid carrier-dependent glycosyltransferase [Candidatus Schekmanbacteria bacterium]